MKLYRIISVDSPWDFDDQGSRIGSARHYPPMTDEQIADLAPLVRVLAAPSCFLFFWAPHAIVIAGRHLPILNRWGFVPKQQIIWRKIASDGRLRFGAGHYARNASEPLLLCTRGRPKVARHDMPNEFSAPRGRHSEKPEESYRYIERLAGRGPRLEMFARRQMPRWDSWGAEAPEATRVG